jgi:hypothetical protein
MVGPDIVFMAYRDEGDGSGGKPASGWAATKLDIE